MNLLGLAGGIALIIVGLYFVVTYLRKYVKHEQDDMGFDSKLIAGGLGCIMIGIALIAKCI